MPAVKHRGKMHPRNVFNTPPDYTALAIKYKNFRQVCTLHLNGNVRIDFKCAKVLRELSKMLLLEFFQLNVNFAPNRLVPTVPLRLNYILWLEDLLSVLQPKAAQVSGIDIGCGSSCIYSLLAAKKNAWRMYALELNDMNLSYAQQNIIDNQLQQLVQVYKQKDANVILKDFFVSTDGGNENSVSENATAAPQTFQFCLCNPPFFDSTLADPFNSTTRNPERRPQPHSCRTGHLAELTCPGGEVKFVERIIEESLQYKERVDIYTSMLGRKSSVPEIIACLKRHEIANYCTTQFAQGNTARWAIAWSFLPTTRLDLKQTESEC